MINNIISIATLIEEGKKIARLKSNRKLDPAIIKSKQDSMKKFGLLTVGIIVDGNKAIEQGLEIEDFETGETITSENAGQYVVLVEGNHRYAAHLELMKEDPDYKFDFNVMYLNENIPIAKALAEINICTKPWGTKQISLGAETILSTKAPTLLREINNLIKEGYSLNASALWLTFNTKINKSVIENALKGDVSSILDNNSGVARGKKILEAAKSKFGEDSCKSRTLPTWIATQYHKTLDEEIPNFCNKMVSFINNLDEVAAKTITKAKGIRGGKTKETIINEELNKNWESYNAQN